MRWRLCRRCHSRRRPKSTKTSFRSAPFQVANARFTASRWDIQFSSDRGDASAPATPMVDAALHQTSGAYARPVATTGSPATMRSVSPRIYAERVTGPDGVTRIIFRQR